MKKTLLLSSSYEVLSFIQEKRVFKLLYKNKCEPISYWDEMVTWSSGSMKYPSILRLTNNFRRNFFNPSNNGFSRKAIIKRDRSICQYCRVRLTPNQITIDHVIPKSLGGASSFTNCVVSCLACNNKKGSKTLEQAGLVLLNKPVHPSFSPYYFIDNQEHWHPDWSDYLAPTSL